MKANEKQKIYDSGVLTPDRHGRMLDELSNITKRAGIKGCPDYLWRPFDQEAFPTEEKAYLKNFKQLSDVHGLFGLCYIGFPESKISKRMLEVTGLLLRNEVDARYMPRADVLSSFRKTNEVTGSAILIPNFCPDVSGKSQKMDYLDYLRETIYDFLLSKLRDGSQVIISATSYHDLEKLYGSSITTHIQTYFGEVS